MKSVKSIISKKKTQQNPVKVFKPLDKKQLVAVVGGPETSRGTETVVTTI